MSTSANYFQLDQKHGWILIYEGREIGDLAYDTIDDPWWVYSLKPRPGQEAACDHVTSLASRERLPPDCYLKNRVSSGVLNQETCLISGTSDCWYVRDWRPHAELVPPRLSKSTIATWLGTLQGLLLTFVFLQLYGLPYITWLVGIGMGFYLAVIELWGYEWLRAR